MESNTKLPITPLNLNGGPALDVILVGRLDGCGASTLQEILASTQAEAAKVERGQGSMAAQGLRRGEEEVVAELQRHASRERAGRQ